jgi:hypothetical protein
VREENIEIIEHSGLHYVGALASLHRNLQPANYVEIGTSSGTTLYSDARLLAARFLSRPQGLERQDARTSDEVHGLVWAGDVWKTAYMLQRLRPDLEIFGLNSPPTGLIAITNLDPGSQKLSRRYCELVQEYRPIQLHSCILQLHTRSEDGGRRAIHSIGAGCKAFRLLHRSYFV